MFIETPSTNTFTRPEAFSGPCPLISTISPKPLFTKFIPGVLLSISSTELYPLSLMSWFVITVTFFICFSTFSVNPVEVTTLSSILPSYFPSACNKAATASKLRIPIFFTITLPYAGLIYFTAYSPFFIYCFFVYWDWYSSRPDFLISP